MNEPRMKAALERIARRNIPDSTDLMPRIAARLEKRTLMKTVRTHPLIAIALVLLLLIILSGVAYAIGRRLGFNPATGIFETSSLRQLAEPVSVERDGFRITVTEAAADSTHTIVRYQVDWLNTPPIDGEFDSDCHGIPSLILADGSNVRSGMAAPDGKGVSENSYWYRIEFPRLPADHNDADLLIPCLVPLHPGSLPRDWRLHLHFVPWDGTPLAPVYEVPTPTTPATKAPDQAIQQLSDYGVMFSLEQVIEVDSGYVFEGSATWTDPNIQPGSPSPYAAHLADAAGRVTPLDWAMPQNAPSGVMQRRWAFRSNEKPKAFPLTITIEGYTLSLMTQAVFPVDLGPNPTPGQIWQLDLDIPVAGHDLHINSAKAQADTGTAALLFDLSADETVVGAGLFDLQNTSGQGGGGGASGEPQPGPFTSTVYYENGLPTGIVQISVVSIDIVVKTPWSTGWQP